MRPLVPQLWNLNPARVNDAPCFRTLIGNSFFEPASNPISQVTSHLKSYCSSMTVNQPDPPLTLKQVF